MLMIIIFGILAVIALAFLIWFNMRASSNQQKNNHSEIKTQTSPAAARDNAKIAIETAEEATEKQTAKAPGEFTSDHTENANLLAASQESLDDSQTPVVAKEARVVTKSANEMMDQEYRHALRQFQNPSKREEEQASETGAEHIKDAEYRKALRSMYHSDQSNRLPNKEK